MNQSIERSVADGAISRIDCKARDFIDERGKTRQLIELDERSALIVMPFVGGKIARAGQVMLVDAFLALRDELESTRDWHDARKEAATSYQTMVDHLTSVRKVSNKKTEQRHHINETRLIYPFPYPADLTQAQQDAISETAPAHQLVIEGVIHFEHQHTTTVEFASIDTYRSAQAITDWSECADLILEAPTGAADDYAFPAVRPASGR